MADKPDVPGPDEFAAIVNEAHPAVKAAVVLTLEDYRDMASRNVEGRPFTPADFLGLVGLGTDDVRAVDALRRLFGAYQGDVDQAELDLKLGMMFGLLVGVSAAGVLLGQQEEVTRLSRPRPIQRRPRGGRRGRGR